MKSFFSHLGCAIIGGIIVVIFTNYYFTKPQTDEQRAIEAAEKVSAIITNTINNTYDASISIQDFVANEFKTNLEIMEVYYIKTHDCAIGKRLKYAMNILIEKSDNAQNIKEYKKLVSHIDNNCKN